MAANNNLRYVHRLNRGKIPAVSGEGYQLPPGGLSGTIGPGLPGQAQKINQLKKTIGFDVYNKASYDGWRKAVKEHNPTRNYIKGQVLSENVFTEMFPWHEDIAPGVGSPCERRRSSGSGHVQASTAIAPADVAIPAALLPSGAPATCAHLLDYAGDDEQDPGSRAPNEDKDGGQQGIRLPLNPGIRQTQSPRRVETVPTSGSRRTHIVQCARLLGSRIHTGFDRNALLGRPRASRSNDDQNDGADNNEPGGDTGKRRDQRDGKIAMIKGSGNVDSHGVTEKV
ncbi:hypothetical protein C7212DRAFT_343016 [Tuber magnatum]|uniref:Uncharacterized protein n=1 Tax=Tuber magnatum TaxID=42249 RepID=A0A317SUX4_9PEZI|nr:hypothetical protein C7212DRAFT_343016 [Tuber magnatum]